ncbi:MAG: polymerase subunit sigma [Hyphomicrobiales bacterium]|nr:polymerase subunit sigma [Hyphomicrobiales bacterium]
MTRVFSDLRPAGMSLDDAMRLVARGERAGLRAIYDLEAPAMIGVAMRILRRRDLAEEAVHDCIVQVWRKAASFDSARGQARAWLYTVLRNRALNILRGERSGSSAGEETLLTLESEGETPEACVARLSDAKALRRCLERLEPARRSMIVLAYAQGLTHGELAGKLGLPLGTVKSTIRRSLSALKECMA